MVDWSKRARVADSILDAAGLTPLVRLRRVTDGVGAQILAKVEYFGPSGSVKDRILPFLVAEAERRGDLRPGMTILEGTTGNTGIATACVAAAKGYSCIIVMPEGMSTERHKTVRAYGAELVLTPGGESDVDLVLEKVRQLKTERPGQLWEVAQFANADNPVAHYRTTGPELWEQTEGRLDAFIASQGTGGTLSGAVRYLKEQNPRLKAYAVEPAECDILSGGTWGEHRIEGIGDGFIPPVLDVSLLDGVVTVTSEESIEMAQRLAREEGIFCGISSGCNVAAALKLARAHPELAVIATMINDNGLRYFSTELCGEAKPELHSPDREHDLSAAEREQLARARLEVIR
jgi:cysteine synthase A